MLQDTILLTLSLKGSEKTEEEFIYIWIFLLELIYIWNFNYRMQACD